MYYSGGIYSSAAHQRAEWEPVDHAVLLVGYGSENGRDLVVGMVGGFGSLGKCLENDGKTHKTIGRIQKMLGEF